MMEGASCLLVSRNVETAGGTLEAMRLMVSSAITPGPLGISETNPTADAPQRIAIQASSTLLIQQILTLVTDLNLIMIAGSRQIDSRRLSITRWTRMFWTKMQVIC
jgi:hypothetical protein